MSSGEDFGEILTHSFLFSLSSLTENHFLWPRSTMNEADGEGRSHKFPLCHMKTQRHEGLGNVLVTLKGSGSRKRMGAYHLKPSSFSSLCSQRLLSGLCEPQYVY